MHKLVYTNKGWSEKSLQLYGDFYYAVVLSLYSGYCLWLNQSLLTTAFIITSVIALISFIYMKKQNINFYLPGFASRFLLFIMVTPVAFLADHWLVLGGGMLFLILWAVADKAKYRFIPQGLMLSLAVTVSGLVFFKSELVSLLTPVFLQLREPEFAGLAMTPSFLRNDPVTLKMSFNFIEGAGFYSLILIPVLFMKRVEYTLSFLMILAGFWATYEYNQLEMAMTWLVIFLQPGRKIFDHPYNTLVSSFLLMLLLISSRPLLLPPLFFIILYFLIEGTSLMILSKFKRSLF